MYLVKVKSPEKTITVRILVSILMLSTNWQYYCGYAFGQQIPRTNIMDYVIGPNLEFTYDQRERVRWVLEHSPWLNQLSSSSQ